MPIVTAPDDEQELERPNLVINKEPFQTVVVDSRKENYDTLSTFVEGSKWACDYYSQLQARDMEAASFQSDLPAPYGQYKLIRGFELVLTSALQHQQSDDGQRGFNSTGSARIYSVITPNCGDIFIADVGNGKNGVFKITNTKRNAIYSESAIEVDFRQTDFLTETIYAELSKRVVETLYFDRENFRNGVKALLNKESVEVMQRLYNSYRRLIHLYLRDFYSDRFGTLVVPDQGVDTYDPFMTNFVKAILDSRVHPKVMKITKLGVSHDVFSDQMTVLDALLNKDDALLYSASQKLGISTVEMYRARPLMHSIYFSGISRVVSVRDAAWNANIAGDREHVTHAFIPSGFRQTSVNSILPDLNLTDDVYDPGEIPLFHSAQATEYYIFSKAFYEDTEGQSVLERLVRERLRGETIDLVQLDRIATELLRADNLDRFYYIPIVLTLIKLAPGVI